MNNYTDQKYASLYTEINRQILLNEATHLATEKLLKASSHFSQRNNNRMKVWG